MEPSRPPRGELHAQRATRHYLCGDGDGEGLGVTCTGNSEGLGVTRTGDGVPTARWSRVNEPGLDAIATPIPIKSARRGTAAYLAHFIGGVPHKRFIAGESYALALPRP